MLYERSTKIAEAKEIMEEQSMPAVLQLIKMTANSCESCYDIGKATDELKKQNVNITKEETISSDSQQGKELISKYNIKKLPTLIVSGEINKTERLAGYFGQKGEIFGNTFVFTALNPPYLDVLSNQIRGKVEIKHVVDSSCEKCVDLSPISSALKEQGAFIEDEEFIEYNSSDGQELINKFEIKDVPAILISEEIDYYTAIRDALVQTGAKKREGFYAVHSTLPPYRNLSLNQIVGLVDIMYLTEDDCSTCYNVTINRNILLRFGMTINNETTYDIDSQQGKQLIQKHNIKKVPIIILSPDAKYYPSLVQAWRSVGTIENDGWFVMRNPEVLGTIWDVEKNRVAETNSS